MSFVYLLLTLHGGNKFLAVATLPWVLFTGMQGCQLNIFKAIRIFGGSLPGLAGHSKLP